MANTFHRVGASVYLRGFHVATLNEDAPATILDETEQIIDECEDDSVPAETHAAELKELEEAASATEKRLRKELKALRRENSELLAQLAQQLEDA